jgi:hypothetical protein
MTLHDIGTVYATVLALASVALVFHLVSRFR